MANLYLNEDELRRWQVDRGDEVYSTNYNLNPNSHVVEIGGFEGAWARKIFYEYACNMYVVEPLPDFFESLQRGLGRHEKVRLLNTGVGLKDGKDMIYLGGDGTSFSAETKNSVEVELRTISRIFDEWGLQEIDLLQMNIEGAEYDILENMIEVGVIDRIKNIQIQFHLGLKNDVERRYYISKGLEARGFKRRFNYPFVWEGWTKN